jgi:hypothetical protein
VFSSFVDTNSWIQVHRMTADDLIWASPLPR